MTYPDLTEEQRRQDSYGSWLAAIAELRRRKEAEEAEDKSREVENGSQDK